MAEPPAPSVKARKERPTVVDLSPLGAQGADEVDTTENGRKRSKAVDLGAVARALRVGQGSSTSAAGVSDTPVMTSPTNAALAPGVPSAKPASMKALSSLDKFPAQGRAAVPVDAPVETSGETPVPVPMPVPMAPTPMATLAETPVVRVDEKAAADKVSTLDEIEPEDGSLDDFEEAGPDSISEGLPSQDTLASEELLPPPTEPPELSSEALADAELSAKGTLAETMTPAISRPEVVIDNSEPLSSIDLVPLDQVTSEAEVLQTGDFEAIELPDDVRPVPPPLPKAARFVLRALSNNLEQSYGIPIADDGVTVGRAQADVVIEGDLRMAPLHGRFVPEPDGVVVEPLDESNGIWMRVRGDVQLGDGELCLVGQQVLRAERVEPLPVAAPTDDGTERLGSKMYVDRPSKVQWRLVQVDHEGRAYNTHYLQDEGCRIGRHVGDWVFTHDTFMSGIHALALPRASHLTLRDLTSRNGTWVKLKSARHLQVGDAVMLGQTILRLGKPAG
ncbi:MAG: FHA domain-containing protein [Bradymonadia bacterium]